MKPLQSIEEHDRDWLMRCGWLVGGFGPAVATVLLVKLLMAILGITA